MHKGNLIVFTGPSGVGKGTIAKQLMASTHGLVKSMSVTTREKRQNEIDGVHYRFVNKEQFDELVKNNELMEWAEFAGNYYGTPRKWVEEQLNLGNDVLLEIEVQGAKQVRKTHPQSLFIFVSPPSFADLEERLKRRATETDDKISLRLRKAKQEMLEKHLFYYEVVNDNIEKAVENLQHIIYAERCRIRKLSPTNFS
jgi:guanylate kinase